MLNKKFINILLIVILIVTTLPLKQVGSLLFKNQITEELGEEYDLSIDKEVKAELKHFHHFHYYTIVISEKQAVNAESYCWFASRLPLSPSCDIHYPPPNNML